MPDILTIPSAGFTLYYVLIYLCAPFSENQISGGYIYNSSLIHYASRHHAVTYVQIKDYESLILPEKTLSEKTVLILDTLFIRRMDFREFIFRQPKGILVLGLVHYLPSLNPFLSREERKILYKKENTYLKELHGFITVSRFMKETLILRGIPKDQISIVRPGIDEEFAEACRRRRKALDSTLKGPPLLLTVAHMLRGKGLVWLLSLLKRLSHIGWRWKIIGDTSLDKRYSEVFFRELSRSGLENRVDCAGVFEQDTMPEEYSRADIFVFPSASESYGMACAEAAAAGLPVIANNTGGIPECIIHRKNGILCSPFRREEWKAALLPMLGKPPVYQPGVYQTWETSSELFISAVRDLECGRD